MWWAKSFILLKFPAYNNQSQGSISGSIFGSGVESDPWEFMLLFAILGAHCIAGQWLCMAIPPRIYYSERWEMTYSTAVHWYRGSFFVAFGVGVECWYFHIEIFLIFVYLIFHRQANSFLSQEGWLSYDRQWLPPMEISTAKTHWGGHCPCPNKKVMYVHSFWNQPQESKFPGEMSPPNFFFFFQWCAEHEFVEASSGDIPH